MNDFDLSSPCVEVCDGMLLYKYGFLEHILIPLVATHSDKVDKNCFPSLNNVIFINLDSLSRFDFVGQGTTFSHSFVANRFYSGKNTLEQVTVDVYVNKLQFFDTVLKKNLIISVPFTVYRNTNGNEVIGNIDVSDVTYWFVKNCNSDENF